MVCLGKHLGHVRGIIWGIILGMSGVSSWACLGHHLTHVLGIIWDMSGASSGAPSGECLGHHLGHVNNGQQSTVLQASVMPFFPFNLG